MEHRELEENQAADAQRMEMREQNISEGSEEVPTSSFERPAPLSTLNNGAAVASTAYSGSVDKTPAWAKAAQAKARKTSLKKVSLIELPVLAMLTLSLHT